MLYINNSEADIYDAEVQCPRKWIIGAISITIRN